MSYQYPLPEGYPPPGATYGPNQTPPPGPGYPPAQGPPPPQGYYPQQGPPPQQQWGPPGGAYSPAGPPTPQGYSPHAGYPPSTGYPQGGAGYPPAGYPEAQIPGDQGYQPGALPYGFQPAGAQPAPTYQPPAHGGQAPRRDNMAAAGYGDTTDPILIAEINAAADLVAGGEDTRREVRRDPVIPAVTPGDTRNETKRESVTSAADSRPFFIMSEGQEKCVLDVRKDSPKPGTPVGLYKKKSKVAPNQLWYIGEDGFIRSKLADLALTAEPNKELHTAVYTGDARQQWLFDGNKIVNKLFRNECLTVMKGLVRYKDDADVHACLYENKPMQHWRREYHDE